VPQTAREIFTDGQRELHLLYPTRADRSDVERVTVGIPNAVAGIDDEEFSGE
jgi:hypothetical protein